MIDGNLYAIAIEMKSGLTFWLDNDGGWTTDRTETRIFSDRANAIDRASSMDIHELKRNFVGTVEAFGVQRLM